MAGSAASTKSAAITNGVVVDTNDTYGAVSYLGFTIRETAAATAVVRVRVGTATGRILDTIALAAGESVADYYGPDGIDCPGDLYCEIVSGTVEGSLRFA